jgi:hypothetical protein
MNNVQLIINNEELKKLKHCVFVPLWQKLMNNEQ